MLNAQFGKIRYLNEVMGVYRVHKDGLWENKNEIYRKERWVDLLDQLKNRFAPEINKILIEQQNREAEYLMMHYIENAGKCQYFAHKLLENDPFYIVKLKRENKLAVENIEGQKVELKRTYEEIELKQEHIDRIVRVKPLDRIQKFRNIIHLLRFYTVIKQSGYFDEPFYLQNNPDVRIAGINPLKHYLMHGGFEGRKPCASFDSMLYLKQNPEVLKSGINPLIHYILNGKK
jgi:hypothetical protein